MPNQEHTDTRVTREPDDALKEFRLSADEMQQAIADRTAIILSIVVEAAYYEDEWWVENRHTKQWVMADRELAGTLERRRDQMRDADDSVSARRKRRHEVLPIIANVADATASD